MLDIPTPANDFMEKRRLWRERREGMEALPYANRLRSSMRRRMHVTAQAAKDLMHRSPAVRRRIDRVLRLGLTELAFSFPDLPAAFDGYRILHLTDLHLDNIDATSALTARLLDGIEADLCVITGDVRDNIYSPVTMVVERLCEVLGPVRLSDGAIGILGNHDTAAMVEPMEDMGIRMLINETAHLSRGGDSIHITGLDDVHMYHTEDATRALADAPEGGFGLALVHSPEVAQQAVSRHSLYLCGHTHGGSLNVPGHGPLITRLKRNRRLARGVWQLNGMVGYTNSGIGASIVPSRFGNRSEVALITLKRGPLSLDAHTLAAA